MIGVKDRDVNVAGLHYMLEMCVSKKKDFQVPTYARSRSGRFRLVPSIL